ncbi:unnamed protein product [Caenorhabditis angaria]|uniref:Uncharacterized protein n=1 Tax=Caenorhabditis angaria TaxID=860376 RepID=A0A9P1N0Y6_9PELO|nr:unnamed protein product [Caenorhabditis angaria]
MQGPNLSGLSHIPLRNENLRKCLEIVDKCQIEQKEMVFRTISQLDEIIHNGYETEGRKSLPEAARVALREMLKIDFPRNKMNVCQQISLAFKCSPATITRLSN